jgi:hypothetical protein
MAQQLAMVMSGNVVGYAKLIAVLDAALRCSEACASMPVGTYWWVLLPQMQMVIESLEARIAALES